MKKYLVVLPLIASCNGLGKLTMDRLGDISKNVLSTHSNSLRGGKLTMNRLGDISKNVLSKRSNSLKGEGALKTFCIDYIIGTMNKIIYSRGTKVALSIEYDLRSYIESGYLPFFNHDKEAKQKVLMLKKAWNNGDAIFDKDPKLGDECKNNVNVNKVLNIPFQIKNTLLNDERLGRLQVFYVDFYSLFKEGRKTVNQCIKSIPFFDMLSEKYRCNSQRTGFFTIENGVIEPCEQDCVPLNPEYNKQNLEEHYRTLLEKQKDLLNHSESFKDLVSYLLQNNCKVVLIGSINCPYFITSVLNHIGLTEKQVKNMLILFKNYYNASQEGCFYTSTILMANTLLGISDNKNKSNGLIVSHKPPNNQSHLLLNSLKPSNINSVYAHIHSHGPSAANIWSDIKKCFLSSSQTWKVFDTP